MAERRKSASGKRARLRPLQFEGLAVRPGGAIADASEAADAARRILRAEKLDWQVRTLGTRATSVLLVPRAGARAPTVAQAWQLAYRLRARRDVAAAEPAFVMPGEGPYHPPPRRGAVGGASAPRACSAFSHWALDLCNVGAAWALVPDAGGAAKGQHIVVAHPDTGILPHRELAGADVRLALGHDFVDDDPDPTDPLRQPNPGHGTSTASVLLSPEGDEAEEHVCGVAPLAALIPLRVSTSVVHFSWTRLTQAIHLALDRGAHVISMSLGGPLPSFALEEALDRALDAGVIAVAAAGNQWPFVVYPARYEQTVGCAACSCLPAPWAGSASGSDVDITAPGESVWRAKSTATSLTGVDRSDGTSYATAHVAGVAALWLAHHGRASLVMKYGAAGVPAVFKELLATVAHANTPANWDRSNYGAGIVDAAAMLAAPLPATVHAAGMAVRRGARRSALGDVDRIAAYFPRADPGRVWAWLAKEFHTAERALPALLASLGDEVAFHVTADPAVYARLHAAVAGRRGAVAPSTRQVFRRASPALKARLA